MHSLLVLHHVTYRPGGLAVDLDFCSFCSFLFACLFVQSSLSLFLGMWNGGRAFPPGVTYVQLPQITIAKRAKVRSPGSGSQPYYHQAKVPAHIGKVALFCMNFPAYSWVGMFCVGQLYYRRSARTQEEQQCSVTCLSEWLPLYLPIWLEATLLGRVGSSTIHAMSAVVNWYRTELQWTKRRK